MKFLTCSPKLLVCSTRCSQIASHCISCLFPKFELSYKYINYSRGRWKESISMLLFWGVPNTSKELLWYGPIKEVLKQSPREGKGVGDDQMGKGEWNCQLKGKESLKTKMLA
jgi:hypothetical protein